MKPFSLLYLLFGAAYCVHLSCPPGYTKTMEACLRVVQTPLTHSQAEYNCTYDGGTLVNIYSAIDNRAISRLASKSGVNQTWIGLFCFNNTDPSSCYYDQLSGTVQYYNNFASGFPLVDGTYGGCVYMSTSDGKWISGKCEALSMPSICEVPVIRHLSTLSCQNPYDRFCYIPMLETTANFSDAQKTCEAQNGNLVSIHAKTELDYIKSLFRGHAGVENIYIGARLKWTNYYEWVDGSGGLIFDYRDPRENGTAPCLSMNVTSGLWSGVSCEARLNYLCQVLIGGTDLTAVASSFEDPEDYSSCNTTFFMIPGTFTSYGYRSLTTTKPAVYCTWRLDALGPSRMWFFFTDVNVYNPIYIYDEDGNQVKVVRNATTFVSETNMASVSFRASGKLGYTGFRATVLEY